MSGFKRINFSVINSSSDTLEVPVLILSTAFLLSIVSLFLGSSLYNLSPLLQELYLDLVSIFLG